MISTGSLICASTDRYSPARSSAPGGMCSAGYPQRAQQRIQRLARLDRRVVIAVQVKEQHPARKPARLAGGVASLHRQRGLAHPGQARYRRHHHGSGVPGRIQQRGDLRQLRPPAGEPGHQCGQLGQRHWRRCPWTMIPDMDITEVPALQHRPLGAAADRAAGLPAARIGHSGLPWSQDGGTGGVAGAAPKVMLLKSRPCSTGPC